MYNERGKCAEGIVCVSSGGLSTSRWARQSVLRRRSRRRASRSAPDAPEGPADATSTCTRSRSTTASRSRYGPRSPSPHREQAASRRRASVALQVSYTLKSRHTDLLTARPERETACAKGDGDTVRRGRASTALGWAAPKLAQVAHSRGSAGLLTRGPYVTLQACNDRRT